MVTTTGGYAELAVAEVGDAVPVPAGVPLRDAVALLADGRTAVLLHRWAEARFRRAAGHRCGTGSTRRGPGSG
ncbi:hypothetical protein [Microbispora sp. CA-102843]|uniref:hypothetical protein n=1 Tax=Microbispora sp. CA-102843 TaxID=3239952 RepID=UPI003D8EF30D